MTTSVARAASSGRSMAWMTCVPDFTEHAVTDDAFAVGRTLGEGLYEALCGRVIAPASMLSAPVSRCSICARALYARNTLGTAEERLDGGTSHRKAGRLGRAVRRWFRS